MNVSIYGLMWIKLYTISMVKISVIDDAVRSLPYSISTIFVTLFMGPIHKGIWCLQSYNNRAPLEFDIAEYQNSKHAVKVFNVEL